jgi:3-isopropylmalate dehydrogenase
MGMAPSADVGDRCGLFQPSHGTGPDIAGQGIANPVGSILSASLMLRYSLGLTEEAAAIERAVETVLNQGCATPDIATQGAQRVSTVEMGRRIAEAVG